VNAPKLVQVLRTQKLERKSTTPYPQQHIYMGVTAENKTRISTAEINCTNVVKEMRGMKQEAKTEP
jgi:hypothetical protein